MLTELRQQNRTAVRCPECGKEAGWHEPFAWLLGEEKLRAERMGLEGTYFNNGLAVALFPEAIAWRDKENPFRSRNAGWCRRIENNWGVIFCHECSTLRKHELEWPRDSFYQVTIKGKLLCARDRHHFVLLRRCRKDPTVIKKMNQLLATT